MQTGMSGMDMPPTVAAAPNWQPAYVTPTAPITDYSTSEANDGMDLHQPRRMPTGTANEMQPTQ